MADMDGLWVCRCRSRCGFGFGCGCVLVLVEKEEGVGEVGVLLLGRKEVGGEEEEGVGCDDRCCALRWWGRKGRGEEVGGRSIKTIRSVS